MVEFKVFSASAGGGNLATLERQINEWMEREQPRVRFFAQTSLGNDLVVSFVFDQEERVEESAYMEEATEVPGIFEESLERSELDPTGVDVPELPEAELPY